MTAALIRPGQPGWFGMNKHHETPKVSTVVSELTGWKIGRVVEHHTGQVDTALRTAPASMTCEEVERYLPLNDLRRLIYDWHRRLGVPHDEIIGRVFGGREVKA